MSGIGSRLARVAGDRRALWALLQAALALGIAGGGRIVLNSVIALGFGPEVFGRYAVLLGGIQLVGGVAAAGPVGAVTLGVARRWAESPGVLSLAHVRLLAVIAAGFLAVTVPIGWWIEGEGALWIVATIAYAAYQILRAFGYALQRAGVVTLAEVAGVIVPLAAVALLLLFTRAPDTEVLVGVWTLGPAVFIAALLVTVGRGLGTSDAPISAVERRLALRESAIFAFGSGSATAMQFLPTVIAGRIESTAVAAILYGALSATAPLLLLSRVYMTVMMPALAAKSDTADGIDAHRLMIGRIFVPSTAIALGVAPWVVTSLGLAIEPFSVSTAAMVGLMTLFHVWATPAVTALSARHQELVPALSSFFGLVLAAISWGGAIALDDPTWLPIGLLAGGFVRSLAPVWIAGGMRLGRVDRALLGRAALLGGTAAIVYACGVLPRLPSLALGAALALAGVAGVARAVLGRGRLEEVRG